MIITGNLLVGAVHVNVDVEFDSHANVAVLWNADTMSFDLLPAEGIYETSIHLSDNTLVYHIGANPLQNVGAAIGDMRTRALGVHNVVVTHRTAANDAIVRLDAAIDRVSSERSRLGALQNRLEHSILNLAVASENLSAAESRIRDVDMAFQMIKFTKNMILVQAGTAMLAQANINPQMVLQLLG